MSNPGTRHAGIETTRTANPGGSTPVPADRVAPFEVKDCALASVATGLRAHDLRELRTLIETVHEGCLFHHFWGSLLRPGFDTPEFRNDFAEWAASGLGDRPLAERLAMIDPTRYRDFAGLRRELIDVLEERLDERALPCTPSERPFSFVRARLVVFDTHRRIERPAELVEALPRLSIGSVFFHFIDARRRTTDGTDDFGAWLREFGPETRALASCLEAVDPYFQTLLELRDTLAEQIRATFTEPTP
jgi:hypothetical protein